jgi:hypothetical protein
MPTRVRQSWTSTLRLFPRHENPAVAGDHKPRAFLSTYFPSAFFVQRLYSAQLWPLDHITVGFLAKTCKHAKLSKQGFWISWTKSLSLLGFKRIELNYTMSLSLATWKPCVVNASQSQESQASYPLGLVVGHQLIDGGCSGHLQQNWLSRGVRVGRHMTQGARWGTSSLALALHADSSCHALGARVWQASDVFWECQHLGVSFPLLRLIRWGVTWKETVKEAR